MHFAQVLVCFFGLIAETWNGTFMQSSAAIYELNLPMLLSVYRANQISDSAVPGFTTKNLVNFNARFMKFSAFPNGLIEWFNTITENEHFSTDGFGQHRPLILINSELPLKHLDFFHRFRQNREPRTDWFNLWYNILKRIYENFN